MHTIKQKCYHCQSTFNPTLKWQIFCSDLCKSKSAKESIDDCFYCGDFATQRDHILPVSYRGSYRIYQGQETVRCCAECNSTLGKKLFEDIIERFDYLILKYVEKFKLKNKVISWSEEELAELSYSLRKDVEFKLSKRNMQEARVGFIKSKQEEIYQLMLDDEENS